ncbi:MAG: SLC13 family permease [Phycisphaerae bacterium]
MAYAGRLLTVALCASCLIGISWYPWHPSPLVRAGSALAAATLVLWVSEIASPGVVAVFIPMAAGLMGILPWKDALTAWGDQIVFLFLGSFLLARALDKFGLFDGVLTSSWMRRMDWGGGMGHVLLILGVSSVLSTVQNNTAVTAMLLPPVVALARRSVAPGALALALSYGATFGGMATPVGTAPNLIGYARMQALDPSVSFLSWMWVGVPVWAGTGLIGWAALAIVRRHASAPITAEVAAAMPTPGPARPEHAAGELRVERDPGESIARRSGLRWAVAAALATIATWLTCSFITTSLPAGEPTRVWVEKNLHESLPAMAAVWLLFLVPLSGTRRTVLDRRDFQALDWDTLFLIAGGLCMGKVIERSGAAEALAQAVGQTQMSPLLLMFALGGVAVLLSELISNTATAALLVPVAASLAPAVGLPPVQTIWLVALCASLGFALPVSTPPNAIVYGTGLIRFRYMLITGIVVDVLALSWVVFCVRVLA